MVGLASVQSALLGQLAIEFISSSPVPVLGMVPNAGAAFTYDLLHDTLLTSAGRVSEIRLEQVVPTYSPTMKVYSVNSGGIESFQP